MRAAGRARSLVLGQRRARFRYDLHGRGHPAMQGPRTGRKGTMPAEPVPRPWRRFLRFSVRGLIVLVLMIGAGLGWLVRQAHVQRDAVHAIKQAHGLASYDINPSKGGFPWTGLAAWRRLIADYIGIDFVFHVTSVNLYGTPPSNDADSASKLSLALPISRSSSK